MKDPPLCSKKFNIAFMKTHKTGSSTIASILNRFTDLENISIALPKHNSHMFPLTLPFSRSFVDFSRLKGNRTNVLNAHMLFNKKEIDEVMYPDYMLITILRDPAKQVRSAYYYFGMEKYYNITAKKHFEHFIRNPFEYYGKNKKIWREEVLLRNSMSTDLNFKGFSYNSDNNIKEFIKYLDIVFDFVLITDLFDESLILLKEKMCWSYFDVTYDKKLVNRKVAAAGNLSNTSKAIIYKQWSHLDTLIYEYFAQKLFRAIEKRDKVIFSQKLYNLNVLNNLIGKFCHTADFAAYIDIMKVAERLGEKPPLLLIEKPFCFCKKFRRHEIKYWKYFKYQKFNSALNDTEIIEKCHF